MNILALNQELEKVAQEVIQSYNEEYFALEFREYICHPKSVKQTLSWIKLDVVFFDTVEIFLMDKEDETLEIFPFAELKNCMDKYEDHIFRKINLDKLEEIIPEKYKELLKEDMASLRTRKRKIENGDIKSEIAEIEHEIKHRQEKLEKLKKAVEK